jgi:3-oxoacyl-[acyl-carrier-protein] synthase II
MGGVSDIVITGIGCVTPMGIGRQDFLDGLLKQQTVIRRLHTCENAEKTTFYGASVDGFDGKLYVTPRKAMKVMGREVQIAYSAAHLAWKDACLTEASLQPDRLGVVYGSEMIPGEIGELTAGIRACHTEDTLHADQWGLLFAKHVFPLWMLKYLPNMPACHVGIAVDARGPNNTIAQEEVSGLLALGEAAGIIARGDTDVMIVGGIGSRITPTRMMYRPSRIYDQHPFDPQTAEQPRCVPFDKRRRGIVSSEGSVALVIESRRHATQRGANILAVLSGYSNRCAEPAERFSGSRLAIASAAHDAMDQAGFSADDLDHVSAQGFSQEKLDIEEAAAIAEVADGVPVTCFSSYFGTAGAACGLMELAASILANRSGKTLPTLGFEQADADCRVNVCTKPREATQQNILKLSFTPHGHAAAVVVQCLK